MKTFTAKELNKSPAQVFRAADQEGFVKINHDRYPDKVFVIEARLRHKYSDSENLNLSPIEAMRVLGKAPGSGLTIDEYKEAEEIKMRTIADVVETLDSIDMPEKLHGFHIVDVPYGVSPRGGIQDHIDKNNLIIPTNAIVCWQNTPNDLVNYRVVWIEDQLKSPPIPDGVFSQPFRLFMNKHIHVK